VSDPAKLPTHLKQSFRPPRRASDGANNAAPSSAAAAAALRDVTNLHPTKPIIDLSSFQFRRGGGAARWQATSKPPGETKEAATDEHQRQAFSWMDRAEMEEAAIEMSGEDLAAEADAEAKQTNEGDEALLAPSKRKPRPNFLLRRKPAQQQDLPLPFSISQLQTQPLLGRTGSLSSVQQFESPPQDIIISPSPPPAVAVDVAITKASKYFAATPGALPKVATPASKPPTATAAAAAQSIPPPDLSDYLPPSASPLLQHTASRGCIPDATSFLLSDQPPTFRSSAHVGAAPMESDSAEGEISDTEAGEQEQYEGTRNQQRHRYARGMKRQRAQLTVGIDPSAPESNVTSIAEKEKRPKVAFQSPLVNNRVRITQPLQPQPPMTFERFRYKPPGTAAAVETQSSQRMEIRQVFVSSEPANASFRASAAAAQPFRPLTIRPNPDRPAEQAAAAAASGGRRMQQAYYYDSDMMPGFGSPPREDDDESAGQFGSAPPATPPSPSPSPGVDDEASPSPSPPAVSQPYVEHAAAGFSSQPEEEPQPAEEEEQPEHPQPLKVQQISCNDMGSIAALTNTAAAQLAPPLFRARTSPLDLLKRFAFTPRGASSALSQVRVSSICTVRT
jgi:hypothetical protein